MGETDPNMTFNVSFRVQNRTSMNSSLGGPVEADNDKESWRPHYAQHRHMHVAG